MGAIYTPAQKRATEKYLKENTEEIKIRVKKGEKEKIKTMAKEKGYSSINRFILDAIEKFNQEKNEKKFNIKKQDKRIKTKKRINTK